MKLNQYNIPQILSYLSIILYLVWSIIIVREDLESGKIKNLRIMAGLKIIGIILLIHISNSILGYFGYSKSYMTLSFYKFYLINILYSLISSYILWYGEIWPAGDAKFFIVSMIFIPLVHYDIYGYPSYLWMFVMINIFIISAIYSLFNYFRDNLTNLLNQKIAFKEIKELYLNKKKSDTKFSNKLFNVFSIFSVFIGKQFLNLILFKHIFNIFHRTDIFFFILFFLWPKISKFLKTKLWKYLILTLYASLSIVTMVSVPDPLNFIKNILTNAIKNTFIFGGIFFTGKIIFEYIIEKHNTYWVDKNEIQEGMILSSKEMKTIKENEVFRELFDDAFKDGLNKEQVDKLKWWMGNHPDKNIKLEFVKSKPFAIGIFLGILLYIILNKDVLNFLRSYFIK